MKKYYLLSVFSIQIMVSFFAVAEENQVNNSDSLCPVSQAGPENKFIPADPSSDNAYQDPNRPLKDFATDMVVNDFFTTPETLFNYIKFVYESLDAAVIAFREKHNLDEKAAYLIFKGGNVLRIIANQEFSLLPPLARDLLKETYGENFKRSDTDFTVILDHKKLGNLDYEDAMESLLQTAYDALKRIREEFSKNPENYFNFFQYKDDFKQKVLEKQFEKLNNLEIISDNKNQDWYGAQFIQLQLLNSRAQATPTCKYFGQFDYRYDFDKDRSIIGTLLNNTPHWLAISLNKTLEWPVEGAPGKNVKFYLARMKLQPEVTYYLSDALRRKPIAGEVIDLSIMHRDDFRYEAFLANQNKWISDYRLTLNDTDKSLKFKAESLSGLSEDLYEVVFEQFSRPWLGNKYQKRINRLFNLMAVEMIGTLGLGSLEAKNYLEEVNTKIIGPLNQLYSESAPSKEIAKEVMANATILAETYTTMATANLFWRGLSKLASEGLINDPKEDDEKEFKSLLQIIGDNLNILQTLSTMPKATIDLRRIYDARMSSFF